MVGQIRHDSGFLCHLSEQIPQGVVAEFAFFEPDFLCFRVKFGGAEVFWPFEQSF